MTTLTELKNRAKKLGIRRYSVVKREELLKVIQKTEKKVYYKSTHCDV